MSLTIQQILNEAKHLSGRLEERNTVADVLLNEANAITKKIEAMKQFQDDVDQLNEVANQKPHSQLIANFQKENRHLRELQQENRELRAALEDYQTTIEHIMSKYREHTSEQIYKTRIDFKTFQNKFYVDVIRRQQEKIQEMAAVMQEAANIDTSNMNDYEKMIVMLKTENKGLKEMLEISYRYGSYVCKTVDKDVQTDNTLTS